MIQVRLNGRPVYANVYLHTRGQLTYHVNFIGENLPDFLKDDIVLQYRDEKLVTIKDGLPEVFIREIIEGIEKHER
jgi:hypothetical protein